MDGWIEGRKGDKEIEKINMYSIQLPTRKLIDLVDVHREPVDDGAGYRFDARFHHFCAILPEEGKGGY